jgi:isoleucyl-tRNA synthetase
MSERANSSSGPGSAYLPLPPHVDLPALDREIVEGWRASKVFERSLEQTAAGPPWTFYEGPPTANGVPGTHHVEARVFKDLFPRVKTMQGYSVPRLAGWDCHGLPVELAVEKELGFTGKPDIEAYGIAQFNEKCRESVQRHVDAFESMSERMGYWADYANAYWTMDSTYVESVWWALQQIFDMGLLVEDYRVSPYCPRCGTGLSDHELGQEGVYTEVVDPSVYVRFGLTSGPLAGQASLLVWTTTPWTLVSNTAVAANPDVEYQLVETPDGERLILFGDGPAGDLLPHGSTVVARYRGSELAGWQYRRPFELVDFPEPHGDTPLHSVVLADYVTTTDGSGLVHQAPAFGADDLAVAREHGLPVVNPIGRDGHFLPDVPLVGGVFFKDADERLVRDLDACGLLFRHLPYAHAYPHCWRCHTPLLYYALPSWYIRTTAIKDRLLAENEATNWFPPTIKHGRYGDWLANNIDWALSRDRYWGTPLPIWRNDADPSRMVCVGSLAQLSDLTGRDLSGLDPHRPFVDEVTFTRPGEAGTYRRVPQVIDAWFDSGSMPFAQFGAPYRNADIARENYPADFICEAVDQTRGWFYTLMAVGTLVFGRSSYRNVVCLGLLVAEDGRKMSKHLGNVLEPMPLMEQHGADAVRWFMLAAGSPWSARRIGHKILDEIASKVLRTYWSVASFQSLYARANDWSPGDGDANVERSALDRWALSRAHQTGLEVDAALAEFDTARAGKALHGLIDDLSNWYVRRSRRRFWDGDPAALGTLHECLCLCTLLLAPFVPFVTERVWQALFAASTGVDSVHLATWPKIDPDSGVIDEKLLDQVALVRRVVELGRAARSGSGVETRQPLPRALVSAPGWAALPEAVRAEVADELNVVELAELARTGELVELTVKPNYRALGRRFGSATRAVAAAITAADPEELVADYRAGIAELVVEGQAVALAPDDLVITEAPRSGWAVASDGPDTVALDLELTPQLRQLGLVRKVIRLIQDARKSAGLQVTDRIELWWRVGGSPEPAEAIRAHADHVAHEVLAVRLTEGAPDQNGLFETTDEELGLHLWLARAAG